MNVLSDQKAKDANFTPAHISYQEKIYDDLYPKITTVETWNNICQSTHRPHYLFDRIRDEFDATNR